MSRGVVYLMIIAFILGVIVGFIGSTLWHGFSCPVPSEEVDIPEEMTRVYVCSEPRPEVCPFLYDPVCGSDGNDYANGCIACTHEEVKWYIKGEC